MSKSTEVMQSMQRLVKLPEIQATMQEMSKEMMKVIVYYFVHVDIDRLNFEVEGRRSINHITNTVNAR